MNTHPLSQLIQSIEDGQGWTDREVSRRIAAAGHKMSHSYIGKLKNHPIQSVNASMVQTLAIGLGIPETVVAEAALASMGVHIDTSEQCGSRRGDRYRRGPHRSRQAPTALAREGDEDRWRRASRRWAEQRPRPSRTGWTSA
ncbi:hypothetical protein [Brachybacterium sp. GPGPB12]|uniref:hypothetical protein n=1 Tax=Brachybacterium sp. GPGPB12 TaxID=3023517 RepID=UPI00313431CE